MKIHIAQSVNNIGNRNSHTAYGIGWAQAGSGPLDLFKMAVGEGGIRSPLIVSGPGIKGDGGFNRNLNISVCRIHYNTYI